ncbi:MAG: GNAT family N-acetyltransferase [Ruminococcaceae bacterium]|nr:GNAT family N-acetyltransferase [Oscillospiraceae bacterium]
MIRIRPMEERDFPFILRINEENVSVLAPMDEAGLRRFGAMAECFLLAELDGEAAGFLIALREGCEGYESENYRWFSRHYPRFLYIDRVVIDAPFRGQGIGRTLYKRVFDRATETRVPFVTAEVDTVPYNAESLAFHAAMGFHEVGTQSVRGGSVTVSLLEAAVE